jgi:hypothetical protein
MTMASQVSTRAPSTTTTASTSHGRNLAPATFQKQIQVAVAVQCMTWVHTLDQMKLMAVHQKLFDSYHGNPVAGVLPMVKDCLSGNPAFESLWESADENAVLTLKHCMTQKEDQLYSVGSSFTYISVSSANQSTSVLIDGRAIYTLATTALRNGKKALAIEKSAYKDGKLPSGWNDDDLDGFVLDGMYKMLTGPILCDDDAEADVEENAQDDVAVADAEAEAAGNALTSTSERPETWIFPGWVAYRLLGPRAHSDHQSILFEVGDWVRNKQNAAGEPKDTGG